MPLKKNEATQLADIIAKSLQTNLRKHKKGFNPDAMPFHYRLLGKNRMELFSFIQSMNTAFGKGIFEPAAEMLAARNYASVIKGHPVGDKISAGAHSVIGDIMSDLTAGPGLPNQRNEISRIRKVCQKGKVMPVNPVQADIFLTCKDGVMIPIDIKTAKPNKSGARGHKETLLTWTAALLFQNPKAKVLPVIGIPYNPFSPNPYEWWTMKGLFVMDEQLLVGKAFWNFLAGEDVYEEFLACFARAGKEMSGEVEACFKRFVQRTEQRKK